MSTKRDYYEILGLSKDATESDIKKAYRTLAKKYHPDVNKAAGSEDKFKEINEAYEILSDPQKQDLVVLEALVAQVLALKTSVIYLVRSLVVDLVVLLPVEQILPDHEKGKIFS